MTEVPKRLGVVGAGVIGLEMGSVWRRLGAQTTVLEALPALLPAADEAVAKEAKRVVREARSRRSIPASRSPASTCRPKKCVVRYTDAEGKAQRETFDRLIVSIGRVPHTAGLGAATVGLGLDERGFVAVDGDCRTNLPQRLGGGRRRPRPDARAQG